MRRHPAFRSPLSARSYAKVERDFAPERMQQGGMETLSRETIALAGGAVEQPYFMVAVRAAEPPQPSERDRFAQRALMAFVNRPGLRVVTSEALRIGGMPGHEAVAESKDDRTGDDLMTVQRLQFGTGGVVQMFGIASKDQWGAVLARLRTVRDGFGPR